MKNDFNEFRFAGLDYKPISNKYYTMERVNQEENKIVVKTAAEQLVETKYGYALILDANHVVFLKPWQVDNNYFGTEVLLTKEYFIVKEWGDFPDYSDNEENRKWNTWLETAKEQNAVIDEEGTRINRVKWAK